MVVITQLQRFQKPAPQEILRFVNKLETEFENVYFPEVQWLWHGKMMAQVFNLTKEI